VLGRGTVEAERADDLGGLGYRSLRGIELDKAGPLPSYERVLAVAGLYRMHPKLQIVFTGGVTNTAAEGPNIAEVMSAEIRHLEVPSGQIILGSVIEAQGWNTSSPDRHCSHPRAAQPRLHPRRRIELKRPGLVEAYGRRSCFIA